jgi:hypothetical protein
MTAVGWLLLDRFNPPQWVWGVCGCLIVIVWIAYAYSSFRSHQVDIFADKADKIDEYGNPTGNRSRSAEMVHPQERTR